MLVEGVYVCVQNVTCTSHVCIIRGVIQMLTGLYGACV